MKIGNFSATSNNNSPIGNRFDTQSFSIPKESNSPKPRPISIALLQKKNYPLNLTLYTPKTSKTPKKKHYGVQEYPEFMNDYISDQTKTKFSATSKIDSKSFSNRFKETEYMNKTYTRDLHPPISLEIPSISYSEYKTSSSYNDKIAEKPSFKIYQPNTVSFSDRSKMTLYTHAPIYYLLERPKPKIKRRNILKPDFLSYNVKKSAGSRRESLNFGENIKKLKEIIKDPLIYEN